MEIREIVRSVYPVSEEWIEKVEACATLMHLKKGEVFIKQGVKNEYFYFVKEGLLRSFSPDGDKENILWFAVSGDIVASMHSIFMGEPAISSVQALVPSDLYKISRTDMEALYEASHELANWGRVVAYEELFALERRYRYIGQGDAYSRYKSFIQMRSTEVVQQIPLKYIAAYLGITPQTLSKIRLKYARE